MSEKVNEETWKKCPLEGFEHYFVSDFGRVRNSKSGQILKPVVNGVFGYRKFNLSSSGRIKQVLVHRLVWMAFRGDIPLTMEVDHVDNDPANNSLANLQLLTRSENSKKRGGGWKIGEGKLRNRPKSKRPMSDERKAKLRVGIKSYQDARRVAMSES